MEYSVNFQFAYEMLKKEIGEEFEILPDRSKNIMIQQKRELLHQEFLSNQKEIKKRRKKDLLTTFEKVDKTLLSNTVGVANKKSKKPKGEMRIYENYSYEGESVDRIDGYVEMHSIKTLLKCKDKIDEIYDEIHGINNICFTPICYMYFKIVNNGEVFGSTKSVQYTKNSGENDLKRLYNILEDTINDMDNNRYGYEDIFDESVSYTLFCFKGVFFPIAENVKYWGEDISKYLICKEFDIFTANDLNKNCVEQCFEYVNLVATHSELDNSVLSFKKENKTLLSNFEEVNTEDVLSPFSKGGNEDILLVRPKKYIDKIQDVQKISDLEVINSEESIKEYIISRDNGKEAKIFLLYKNHMGVLCNLNKKVNKEGNITKYRGLKNINNEGQITVCFDIECFFDPCKITRHIPYLCCCCFIEEEEISEIFDFEGSKSVLDMLDFIVYFVKRKGIKQVELIAHNGGAYDFHYIISSLPDPSIVKNILIRNNNFIGFSFKYKKIKFSVKDSFCFLLCSLKNAAKAFLKEDIGKTEFPHHEVKTEDILNKEYKKWKSVNFYIDNEISEDGSKLWIKSRNEIIFDEDNVESKKLIEWAKEYCSNDVFVLAKVWQAFKNATKDIFKVNIVDQSMTLAGLSLKLFVAYLDEDVILVHPPLEDYKNMRSSLIGGRCISLNGIYKDILCLDVKSLYPAAMSFYEQPYGDYFRSKEYIKDLLGIYYVKVRLNKINKTGFFPIKINNNVVYKNNGEIFEYDAWYTSVDIAIGIEEGHLIEYISFDNEGNVGYVWKKKGYIFSNYINNVLYKYKLQYEQEGNQVKRTVIKIIMNSLWGKFAQKWIDTNYKIKHVSDIKFEEEDAYQIWDSDYLLVKTKEIDKGSAKSIQNGVYTLSWARWHMKKLWDAAAKENAQCVYSDTDSIFVNKNEFNINSEFLLNNQKTKVIGDNIGQLEIECEFFELICAGKKQYIGYYLLEDPSVLPFEKGNKTSLLTSLSNSEGVASNFSKGSTGVGTKKRFKGIPQQYIIPDMYKHLIENEGNTVQVDFLKFKREWGSVKGYIEEKTLKAT